MQKSVISEINGYGRNSLGKRIDKPVKEKELRTWIELNNIWWYLLPKHFNIQHLIEFSQQFPFNR